MSKELTLLISFISLLSLVNATQASLVAYYEFENNVNDSVGTKHGDPNGDPTYSAAVYNLGIDMDGDGDYVTVSDGGATEFEDGNFSIAFWMKTPNDFNFWGIDPNKNFRQVFINGRKGTGSPATGGYTEARYEFYYDVWGVPFFWLGDGVEYTYPENVIGSTHWDCYRGEWTHVTIVRDRNPAVSHRNYYKDGNPNIQHELRFYLNGSMKEWPMEDATGDIKSVGEPLLIGAAPALPNEPNINGIDPNSFFRGMLDDLRFYNHALAEDEIVKLARPDRMVATNPSPRINERAVGINSDLSWLAGEDANGHDVYFGTNFSDVNTATRTSANSVLLSVNRIDPNYQLSTLSLNKTYYWRIDEVNDSNIAQWPGEVWSFTTRGVPLVEPNLVAWYKFDGDANDYSGYGNHATLGGNSCYGSGKFGGCLQLTENLARGKMEDYVDCGNGTIFDFTENFTIMAWILKPADQHNGSAGIVTKGKTAWSFKGDATDSLRFYCRGLADDHIKGHWDYHYMGQWRHVAAVYDGTKTYIYVMGELEKCEESTGSVNVNKEPVYIGANVARYGFCWPGRIDDVRIYNRALSQDEIRSTFFPPPPFDPFPADGANWAKDPNEDLVLTWSAIDAASYDVYFGANEVNVTYADNPAVLPGRGTTSNKWFDIGAIETFDLGKRYYWRVDTVNEPNLTKGPVWHFTVADYLLMDDFESYHSDSDLTDVWSKGGRGYVKLNLTSGKPHEGDRSMVVVYCNYAGYTSYIEAINTYNIAQDWTTEDVNMLTLYFLGEPGNGSDPLYVELADNQGHAAMVNHPDVNAITEPVVWQEWNIDLRNFTSPTQPSANDVNLTDIGSVIVGIGDKYGSASNHEGVVSFDDFRLYPSRCVLDYGPAADFTGDCNVDYQDINALELSWLDTATAPNDSNLLGYWQLNDNGNDSSGNGNTGTTSGDTVYGLGKSGKALGLFGDNDYMTVGNDSSFAFTGPFTVSAWIRSNGGGGSNSQTIVAKGGSAWRLYTISQDDKIEFAVDGLDTCNNPDPNVPEQSVSTELVVEDSQWHHVAGVYDGSYLYVYADGVPKVLDINDSCTPYTDSNDVWFGQNKDYDVESDDYREWEGYIDEVRIYDYALSEAEIDYLAELPMDLTGDDKVNFKDIAELGKAWLKKHWWP